MDVNLSHGWNSDFKTYSGFFDLTSTAPSVRFIHLISVLPC